MMRSKKRLHKKLSKSQIISRIMYFIAGIAILSIIGATTDLFYDYKYQIEKQKGYPTENLYNSFIDKDYGALIQHIKYNIAAGKEITKEDADYYAFAECYDSAMDYYMYEKTEQNDLASEALSKFRDNEQKLTGKIFKDSLKTVKETYKIP